MGGGASRDSEKKEEGEGREREREGGQRERERQRQRGGRRGETEIAKVERGTEAGKEGEEERGDTNRYSDCCSRSWWSKKKKKKGKEKKVTAHRQFKKSKARL